MRPSLPLLRRRNNVVKGPKKGTIQPSLTPSFFDVEGNLSPAAKDFLLLLLRTKVPLSSLPLLRAVKECPAGRGREGSLPPLLGRPFANRRFFTVLCEGWCQHTRKREERQEIRQQLSGGKWGKKTRGRGGGREGGGRRRACEPNSGTKFEASSSSSSSMLNPTAALYLSCGLFLGFLSKLPPFSPPPVGPAKFFLDEGGGEEKIPWAAE